MQAASRMHGLDGETAGDSAVARDSRHMLQLLRRCKQQNLRRLPSLWQHAIRKTQWQLKCHETCLFLICRGCLNSMMGSEPAEIMQPHAKHAASCSYSTDDRALQLQTASLQRSIAAADQSPAMPPLAPFVPSEHITPYTLPAGAAACGSMPPAALSAAPAEELLLWDRRHASAAAAAVSRADSLCVCSTSHAQVPMNQADAAITRSLRAHIT